MSGNFSFFFLQNWKKWKQEKNLFYILVFDPIKIKTCLAPQNVHQNLSFVKHSNVVCQKMSRNCRKIVPKPICALHFRYVFRLTKFQILKYKYLLLFTLSWEKESLIGQRFRQISKSLDDIPRTKNSNSKRTYFKSSASSNKRQRAQDHYS